MRTRDVGKKIPAIRQQSLFSAEKFYIYSFPLSVSHQDRGVICLIQQGREVVRQTDSSPRLLLTFQSFRALS